jgi:hypothetical protein
MSGIPDYSSTPASNTTINSISIIGNASPAGFDNALRQLMADLATARTDGALASMPYATKSAGYTLLTTDRGKLIDCTAAMEIELLAAATAGAGFFFVVKANGGAVTLDPNGVEEINGSATSLVVADGTSAIVACNGTAWFAVVIGQGDVTQTGTQTLTNKTLTTPTITTPLVNSGLELGHASDTTLSRSAAGVMAVEGNVVPSPASQATGDILVRGASSWSRLAIGAYGQVPRVNSGATAIEYTGAGAPDVIIEDQKAAGTDGGTFTSGAWRTRTLNTEVKDTYSLASISSNEVTFTVAGVVKWSAPGYGVNTHKTRLYNVTDATVAGTGSSERAGGISVGVMTRSSGECAVVAGKAYRIEHQCGTTENTDGFGIASDFSQIEIYSRLEFWRT